MGKLQLEGPREVKKGKGFTILKKKYVRENMMKRYDVRLEKTDLKVFVDVIPKEGWKDGRSHARPSFFGYDTDKDFKVGFLMTCVISGLAHFRPQVEIPGVNRIFFQVGKFFDTIDINK